MFVATVGNFLVNALKIKKVRVGLYSNYESFLHVHILKQTNFEHAVKVTLLLSDY